MGDNLSQSNNKPAAFGGADADALFGARLPTMRADAPAPLAAEYNKLRDSAIAVLQEEQDPQRRVQLLQTYDKYLHTWADDAATGRQNLSAYVNQAAHTNPAVKDAIDRLSNQHSPPFYAQWFGNMYDAKKAKAEDSTLAGIKPGGAMGMVAGLFAGYKLAVAGGQSDLMAAAAALLGGIGLAYGGRKLEEYARGTGTEPPVPTPAARSGNGLERPAANRLPEVNIPIVNVQDVGTLSPQQTPAVEPPKNSTPTPPRK